ncbi:MAG TPA: hypothetical protein VF398_12075 [bacterium]|jgi:hypothetical protein
MRYYYRKTNWYQYQENKRNALSSVIGGIDKDITELLFAFDQKSQEVFFGDYEVKYGRKAANYARKIFPQWKTKQKRYSAETIQKFIQLVPRHLSYDQRYDLLKKLYDSWRRSEKHEIEIVLGHDERGFKQVEILCEHFCNKPAKHTLPDEVQNLMEWVCDHDANQARILMAAIEEETSILITRAARADLARLKFALKESDTSIIGKHEIRLPYGEIVVNIRMPRFIEKLKKAIIGG